MFIHAGDLIAPFVQNSFPGLLVFIISVAIVFGLIARKSWRKYLSGIARVFITAFTTPFEFLRDALTIIASSQDAEKQYTGTREFVLFRYSRILYLIIFAVAVIYLSAGLSASILTLYPKAEADQHNGLHTALVSFQNDLPAANKAVADASSPNYKKMLEQNKATTFAAYRNQLISDGAFIQSSPVKGGEMDKVNGIADIDTLNAERAGLPAFFANCPYGAPFNSLNYTVEGCSIFIANVNELVDRKARELTLQNAFNQANIAAQSAETALNDANIRLNQLKANIAETQKQFDGSSLWRLNWLFPHIISALVKLLVTALGFILTMWFSAILVDLLNWVILAMRSIEKKHTDRLSNGDADEKMDPVASA